MFKCERMSEREAITTIEPGRWKKKMRIGVWWKWFGWMASHGMDATGEMALCAFRGQFFFTAPIAHNISTTPRMLPIDENVEKNYVLAAFCLWLLLLYLLLQCNHIEWLLAVNCTSHICTHTHHTLSLWPPLHRTIFRWIDVRKFRFLRPQYKRSRLQFSCYHSPL